MSRFRVQAVCKSKAYASFTSLAPLCQPAILALCGVAAHDVLHAPDFVNVGLHEFLLTSTPFMCPDTQYA